MEKNWFEKFFINEAKAAINSRSPSGSSGENSQIPTYNGEVEVK